MFQKINKYIYIYMCVCVYIHIHTQVHIYLCVCVIISVCFYIYGSKLCWKSLINLMCEGLPLVLAKFEQGFNPRGQSFKKHRFETRMLGTPRNRSSILGQAAKIGFLRAKRMCQVTVFLQEIIPSIMHTGMKPSNLRHCDVGPNTPNLQTGA